MIIRMRNGSTLAIFGVVATIAVLTLSEQPHLISLFSFDMDSDKVDFANFLTKHGKSYGT